MTVVLVVLLSGCLGGSDDFEARNGDGGPGPGGGSGLGFQRSSDTTLEEELDAFRLVSSYEEHWAHGNVSRDNWFLLSQSSSSAGNVVAYKIEITADVMVAGELIMEFVPATGPMGVDVLSEDTAYAALLLRDDATVDDFFVQSAVEVDEGGEKSVSPASSGGFTLRGEGMSQGETVHVVVAARGGASEFGLGMRFLGSEGSDLSDNVATVDSWGEFHAQVGQEVPPFVPERAGEGSGLHHAFYSEVHESSNYEIRRTQDVAVTDEFPDALYPVGTTRALTLSSSADWGGWSHANGRYISAGEPGQWAASMDVHGVAALEVEGLFLNMHFGDMLPVQGELPPAFHGRGEGSSGALFSYSLMKGGTVATYEDLLFFHFAVGIQFSDLVGGSSTPIVTADGGLPQP